MSKTIWHCGGWMGYNYGDRVLQIATADILKEHYDGDLQFVAIDNQKTWFSPQLIDKMNREADMLLIGGGGFVMHRQEDSSRSGWQLNIETKDISKIQIPMVAYGLGYNRFPHDSHVFPKSMWDNLYYVREKCDMFSVRNYGTFFELEGMLGPDDTEVVPDPGMFIKPTPYKHPCLDRPGMKIGVNWATDRAAQRFGSGAAATLAMRNFFSTLRQVADKYDAHVYLIDHLLREERNKEWKDITHHCVESTLGDRVSIMYNETFEELFPPFDYTAGFFADI